MKSFELFNKSKNISENYWFKIIKKLAEESGKTPDPLQIRAAILINTFGLPSGPYSAIEVDKQGKIINLERDKIIAEYLTNKPGILIDKEKGIISFDFRDLYPKGLPKKLKEALDPNTLAIMEIEYEHSKYVRKKLKDGEYIVEFDCNVNYFRLPGGINLFIKGYKHDKQWQEKHGKFLKEINKKAKIICIEGFANEPFGKSLDLYWSSQKDQQGDYDVLMHEAVEAGFNGLFTEIDARDTSKVDMDSKIFLAIFPKNLSDAFFEKFFQYLQREHPKLTEIINSPEKLKKNLKTQSTMTRKIKMKQVEIYQQGKYYITPFYLTKEGKISFEPTFLELGQHLFTDALAAIKLHLIAKLMTDGYLEKGPIIDYEGFGHLPTKTFFLQYPQYAMEVVLRMINELMAGKVENIEGIYKVFEKPNWQEAIREITHLVFKKVEEDPSKTITLGPNQRKLIDVPIDFLKIYGINPQTIMPSDKEIEKIREKIAQKYKN